MFVISINSNFQKLLENKVFELYYIAPGKSGNKNVNLREKYKCTKFPNESDNS